MNKIEQQEILKKLVQNLEKGKQSAHMIKSLIPHKNPRIIKIENDDNDQRHQDDHYKAAVDHHCMVCLDTFDTSLSMLKSLDFDGVFARERKLEDDVISEHMLGSPTMSTTVNGSTGVESSKKRKIGDLREEEVTHLTDDGFTWRKYGQKSIYNCDYPRHYYRCTHKNDQSCPATKYVQQISEEPTKYKIVYHYNHTCDSNNILKNPLVIIDSPRDHPSTIVINFNGSNQVNPMLFPTSAFPCAMSQAASPASISTNNHPISQDTTITTASTVHSSYMGFTEGIDIPPMCENDRSTACSNLEGEDFSCIMADFSDLLPDWWTK